MRLNPGQLALAIYGSLCALASIPAVFLALFTPMLFDAPTAIDDPRVITFALGILVLPVLCLVCAVLAGGAARRQSRKLWITSLVLPVAWVIFMAASNRFLNSF